MSELDVVLLLQTIANEYGFYSNIFILSIGLVSNTFLVLIFTKLRLFRDNQCAYYLKIGSITDVGVLLATLPSDIVGYAWNANPAGLSVIWCKIQLMWSYSCGLYSLFTICFLAFDQYLSTNHQQSWRQRSTLKLAHCLTYLNISMALFHGVLFLIFAEIDKLGCSIYHPIVKLYFICFYYPILSGVLPLIISGTFSLLAYRNVRRIVRRQVPIVRRRLDRQMTAIALARVLCIVILGLPFIGYSLFQATTIPTIDDARAKAIANLVSVVVLSLLYTNYAINFYIFLFVSSRFRCQTKHFVVKKCWRKLMQLCSDRTTTPRINQVAPEIEVRVASIVESV